MAIARLAPGGRSIGGRREVTHSTDTFILSRPEPEHFTIMFSEAPIANAVRATTRAPDGCTL